VADFCLPISEYPDLSARYDFTGKLGGGAFGDVFQAIDRRSGVEVAIKTLRPEENADTSIGISRSRQRTDRFRREMQLSAEFSHPSVVRMIESGETDSGRLYIVFEYIRGCSLDKLLETEGSLSVQRSYDLIVQVLEGLTAAHDKGIIHRDVKPANIMVTQDIGTERAKILDFGISTFAQGGWQGNSNRLTQTHEFVGTALYAAPEQLRGDPVTTKVDIYSWGLVFLECLTGQSPFKGVSAAQVVQRQLSPAPVPIPVSLAEHPLGVLLRWVLEKDPMRRAGDSKAVLERLKCSRLNGLSGPGGYLIDIKNEKEVAETVRSRVRPSFQERRQVTVLSFSIDLGDDAGCLNPELLDELFCNLVDIHINKIVEYKGHMVGSFGDRGIAFFGFPDANETDARCAVRAALEISALATRRRTALKNQYGIDLSYRIGLHTGMIASGDPSKAHAAGITPSIADKLCSAAAPNTILVSENCYRLIKTTAECEPLASPLASSLPASTGALYRVLGEPCGEGIYSVINESAYPLVGRQHELDYLRDAWRKTSDVDGVNAILIVGEAGIGKSRLAAEFAHRVRSTGGVWLECRCLPERKSSALFPVLTLLRRHLEITELGDCDQAVTVLEKQLAKYDIDLPAVMPHLCVWLGLTSSAYPPPQLSPQRQKEKILACAAELLAKIAYLSDGVFMIEDLHWADAATLELLPKIFDEMKARGRLALASARPVFTSPWHRNDIQVLPLSGLDHTEIETLIAHRTRGLSMPKPLIARMVTHSDGIPLFAEELTKMVIEKGIGSDLAIALNTQIPSTLRDLFIARIDRLGPAKETAQLAAAIGRTFDYDLIAKASGRDEATILADLDQMVSAGLIQRRLRVRNPQYAFHHALLRDAVYDGLTVTTRKEIHLRIVQAIETSFKEMIDGQPELFAYHLAGSGNHERAVVYGLKAVNHLLSLSLYADAISTATEAIEWSRKIDNRLRSVELELQLSSILLSALIASTGFSSDVVRDLTIRTEALSRELPEDSQMLFSVLWGMIIYCHARPVYDRLDTLVRRALPIASKGKSGELAALKAIMGHRSYSKGDLDNAVVLLNEAIDLYDETSHRDHAIKYGHDTQVFALSTLSLVLTLMGRIGEAKEVSHKAINWAAELNSAQSTAMALAYQLGIYHYLGDAEELVVRADQLIDYAERFDVPNWLLPAQLLGGWAKGNREAAEGGVQILDALGVGQFASYWHFPLAQLEFEQGLYDQAMARLSKYIVQSLAVQEPFYLPELFRLRALCRLKRDSVDMRGALEDFENAIAYAAASGAKLLQLSAINELLSNSVPIEEARRAQYGRERKRLIEWFRDESGEKRTRLAQDNTIGAGEAISLLRNRLDTDKQGAHHG
jgi:TOMM system kinase/cyclase fusion protein